MSLLRIRGGAGVLMNSRRHRSEDALAEFACTRPGAIENSQILIGGPGMGFTLAAVLKTAGVSAEVIVVELVPAMVEW
jgi:spermidine synthase